MSNNTARSNTLQIFRSAHSAYDAGTDPTDLNYGELAWNNGSAKLWIGQQTTSGSPGTITPYHLNPAAALDTAGLVELATVDETNTGTDAGRAVTPAGLTGWTGDTGIVTVGEIATGTWSGTALVAGKVPSLDAITVPAGDVSLNSHKITSLATCTVDTDAATKGYVDSKAQGLDVKASVRLATAADLPACTYGQPASATGVGATLTANANGALSVDSVAVALNDRILVQHQGTGTETAAHNGIYTVTTLGTGSAAWVLTRATDFDENDEVTASAFVFVEAGTINADSGHVVNTDGAITFASDTFSGVGWSQFSGAGQVTAGNGLTKAGNIIHAAGTTNRISVGADAIDIDSGYVGQDTITTLGTIGTGTWNGTAINATYLDGQSGTNTGDISLAADPEDYISLSGQVLTIGEDDMSDNETGTLAVGNGGTGATTFTTKGVLYGAAAGAIAVTAAGTTGQLLTGNGASSSETAPTWQSSLSGITIDCGTFIATS